MKTTVDRFGTTVKTNDWVLYQDVQDYYPTVVKFAQVMRIYSDHVSLSGEDNVDIRATSEEIISIEDSPSLMAAALKVMKPKGVKLL